MAATPTLILVANPSAALTVTDAGRPASPVHDISALEAVVETDGHALRPIHPGSAHEVLSTHFEVVAPQERLQELASRLRTHPALDGAYVKPPGNLPVADHAGVLLDPQHPDVGAPPDVTPDYRPRQGYLDAPPIGVGALEAWKLEGGRGEGVHIIDCEFGWNFDHEDLREEMRGVVHGTPTDNKDWIQHGTAVLGIIASDLNATGVSGVAPGSTVSSVSLLGGAAAAIRWAADSLKPGDIIVLEQERNLDNGSAVTPYSPIEWWPDDFAAIRYAVDRGVLVVEAAGNGGASLDDAIYDKPDSGFPSGWKNPLGAGGPDSGAIVVGAGNPPAGTHGRTAWPSGDHAGEVYVDRARCGFSNYGSRVDTQGWGWEVTSTGYGSLPPKHTDSNRWYMDRFNGTSSASPVIVGVLACVQGVLRAKGRPPMSPEQARTLLRTTGSPQQDGPGRPSSQRIGTRPDIGAMLGVLGVT